jgi:hypothetical protein
VKFNGEKKVKIFFGGMSGLWRRLTPTQMRAEEKMEERQTDFKLSNG